jgi:hypothetical protein
MPRKNFKNFGDLQQYEYVPGVIDSIDGEADTCSVTIGENSYSDIPIYYHCLPDSPLRDNGAIEGAAAGFVAGDLVVVLRQRISESMAGDFEQKLFVIGHIGFARRCLQGLLVFSTQSGDEAIVWDLKTNTLHTSKTSLESLGMAMAEAVPTGSETQIDTFPLATNGGNCIRNLPNLNSGFAEIVGSAAVATYYNAGTAPPMVLFGIRGACFQGSWDMGDSVTFTTAAGSTNIVVTAVNSAGGTFNSAYMIQPSLGGAVTDTWTIEVYSWNETLYWYVSGALTGEVGSGYPFTYHMPWSSSEAAASGQWTIYYNELEGQELPCAPYFFQFFGYAVPDDANGGDILRNDFEAATGISWPMDPSGARENEVQAVTMFFNHVFGPDFSNMDMVWNNVLAEGMTRVWDFWEHTNWNFDYWAASTSEFWLTTGIADTVQAAIVFDAFSVCADVNLETDICADYESYFSSDFHIFYTLKNYLRGIPLLVFHKINEQRTAAGVPELSFNHCLQKAAERHATDTAANLIEGHTGSDGSTYQERIEEAGYLIYRNEKFQSTNYGTENFGIAPAGLTAEEIATGMVAAWMESETHRENLLNENHTEMGIDCRIGSDGRYYFSNTFGYVADRWPGFSPLNPVDLKAYIDENFTWAGDGDETRLPRIFIA